MATAKKKDKKGKAKDKTDKVNANNAETAIATEAKKKVSTPEELREQARAGLPDVAPMAFELTDAQKEQVITDCRAKFEARAQVTNLTTDDQVKAAEEVIELVEAGHVWSESEELRGAFARCTNSFSKGPVLMADLQLLCGKIVEFDPIEVPIFKTGAKIGTRWVYQDTLRFFDVAGRLPVTAGEVFVDGGTPDKSAQKTFLSHCARCEIDFWAPEASHQLHCPVCSKEMKQSTASSGSKINEPGVALAALRRRLVSMGKLAEVASEGAKAQINQRIESIKSNIATLEKNEAAVNED
jgi:hypothetical protein